MSLWPPRGTGLCEDNGLDYVFGLSGNKISRRRRRFRGRRYSHSPRVETDTRPARLCANELRRQIMESRAPRLRPHRGDGTRLDIRYVVTNIANGSPEHIYDTLYCARRPDGKSDQIAQSPTGVGSHSCRSPLANQMRLVLHTAAYC